MPDALLLALRILAVDDDDDARELFELMLSRAGALVHTAASAPEALRLLPSFRPHVLVSDIGMPGEDGYSLIGKVRQLPTEAGGATPSIAVTAHSLPADRAMALRAGFNLHLGKPVDFDSLIDSIRSLAAASSAPDPR